MKSKTIGNISCLMEAYLLGVVSFVGVATLVTDKEGAVVITKLPTFKTLLTFVADP